MLKSDLIMTGYVRIAIFKMGNSYLEMIMHSGDVLTWTLLAHGRYVQ